MAKSVIRSTRLEARVSPDVLEAVKRAAEIQGRSISDFVVTAAEQAARRAIEDAQLIRLSVEDQRKLVETLLNPPKPTPALRRAMQAHKRLIAKSR
jgi:uncharacterized protein (DUF1778 family)